MQTQINVWDGLAAGWYRLRHHTRFGRELGELALRWGGGRLLNIGCAHGPDFIPFTNYRFELYGVDFSLRMLELGRKYQGKFGFKAHLLLADIRALPFASDSFDWAIAAAVYHHLPPQEQLKAFKELWRVLKPGGEAFITVWNRWQFRFLFKPKEIFVPWREGGKIYRRYYYLFSPGELRRIVQKSGFKILEQRAESSYHFPIKIFSKNICILMRKS